MCVWVQWFSYNANFVKIMHDMNPTMENSGFFPRNASFVILAQSIVSYFFRMQVEELFGLSMDQEYFKWGMRTRKTQK